MEHQVNHEFTAAFVSERISYDPETGEFLRKACHRSALVSKPAGTPHRGYLSIGVGGRNFRAHRLAWLLMTGDWPTAGVDHINGDRSDNRWCNLRLASASLNNQNVRRPRKSNKLGFLGVHPSRRGTYAAQISHNGRLVWIGRFATPEEAHAAYLAKKRLLHEGCTI